MIANKKCNVLIHSASGHTRATTVLVAYLHIYQKHPEWEDMQCLCDFVGSFHDQSFPSFELLQKVEEIHIKKCIEQEKDIQEALKETLNEDIVGIREVELNEADDIFLETPHIVEERKTNGYKLNSIDQ
jgi:hypothetical protein